MERASRRLCGFRPTGKLHLGHYFSVIKPALTGCDVLIADYHIPLKESFTEVNTKQLLEANIKPEKIILQSRIFNAELFFQLLCVSSVPELSRMPQFKTADKKDQTAQLLTYPVLMAHDVVGYNEVYVGEDQLPHLEFAKKILGRLGINNPKPIITTEKIMDLRDSQKKMSKSQPNGCIFLNDSFESIKKKLQRAVTDPAGVNNLQVLYNEFVGYEFPTSYGRAKEELADCMYNRFGLLGLN